ncbi:DUF2726 domain-containing protein [Arenicella xantha]|uniref:Topoisomerase-like DNA binding C4 zinc finger protein n=1 Tax=Arenicella xantha TaxID=644221 RepID=A0A395JLH4_9GAMM|nr:DUF2726 domain-containing protein [Arenicella xantha]RBP51561.1 topoisomerase-like DNA binding C4 zinc finger protein [Arenicella xantha]
MSLGVTGFGWILIILAWLVLIGGAGYWWIRNKASAAEFDVQRKSRMLTAAERNFFDGLMSSLSDEFYIFSKIRILDVIEPEPAVDWFQSKRIEVKLADQTFDYLLCKKKDMSIFGVIELENFEKGSNRKMRAAREKTVSHVCKQANVRLFYFDIRQDYRSMDIRRLVTGKSAREVEKKKPTKNSELTIDGASNSDFGNLRQCPKCHSGLVTKVAVKGRRIGEKFLMCRKYPYCDYQVSMNDAKVVKMQTREKQKVKKPGFSDWAG